MLEQAEPGSVDPLKEYCFLAGVSEGTRHPQSGPSGANGPDRPLTGHHVAAAQLPQNGHSIIAQHFHQSDDGSVNQADIHLLAGLPDTWTPSLAWR